MSNFSAVYSQAKTVLNRFIARTENKSKGRYTYGAKDNLPQEIIELISSNPVAFRAILKRAEYIVANGFSDPTLNDLEVTKGKTAYKLLSETAIQYAMFECVCWHVARNAGGIPASVDIHPFEMCRRRIGGDIDYNDTIMTQNFSEANYKTYPAFKKGNKVSSIGEILYHWNRTPIAFNFPIPSWFTGEFTIKTGAELALMDLELVENGFMPSSVLTYIGQLDDVEIDPKTGLTQREAFKKNLEKWTSKSKDPATGKSMRFSVMVLNAENKDMVAVLQSVDNKQVISGSIEKKAANDKDTCRVFDVNPTLLNFDAESFFSSGDAIKNIKANMADSVLGAQSLIKECFEMVYPDKKWDITTLNPYKAVVEKDENQKILDTLNSLSPLLAAEIVKNMPPEKLLSLVGINDNISQ